MGIDELFEPMSPEPEVALEAPIIEAEQPQIEPATEQPAQTPAEPPKEEEPRHVPLATFLDQRDEAKRWKREAEEAKAQLAQRQPATQAPDPFDDPAGFSAHQNRVLNEAIIGQRFQTSELIAKQMHGAETVDAAGEWANEQAKINPGFVTAYMQQPHPIDWIVQQHKRDQLMQQIGDDPDDFVRRRFAELNPIPAPSAAPVAAQQQQASVPPPPRSLASLPGNGGGVQAVPVGPLAASDALFNR